MSLDRLGPRSAASSDSNDLSSPEPGVAERGAVFTRREVVEFILDLVGYTDDLDLASARLLEPAAGHADFLVPIIGRLIRSFLARGGCLSKTGGLDKALLAYEVDAQSASTAQGVVTVELLRLGLPPAAARRLACKWIRQGDFLTTELPGDFDFVVGNPPYVRQELIPEAKLADYRSRFNTFYDRADLYVPFFERSLEALTAGGRLGFICTDRWTKNKYGGPLRAMVAEHFALTHFVDMVDTPAFLTEVMTYPAITVIERLAAGAVPPAVRIAYRPEIDTESLGRLAGELTSDRAQNLHSVVEMPPLGRGSEPWLLDRPDRLALVRRLEAMLPTLQEAGCKVGIGVASGNDKVYIAPMKELDVEPSRKLPLVRTQDILAGHVRWQGMGILNPFEVDGSVVDLNRYPRFAAYLERNAKAIRARNVARKNPDRWFRTIDRIYPELAKTQKLLIPDIKGDAHIVFEEGKLYPHHNLYFITATHWDLHALQAVLMSGIARLFVGAYSTAMRGGFLRFQAQYLRRIRVPAWADVPEHLKEDLRAAALAGDKVAANEATYELYGLSKAERDVVASA